MGRLKGSRNKPKEFVDPITYIDKAATARATKASNIRAKNMESFPGRKSHPSTADVIYTPDELEFLSAIQEFIRVSGRRFPTWSEALSVIRALGYVKRTNTLPLHTGYDPSDPVVALVSPTKEYRKRKG